jgi:ATP-dependent DNA ligase
MSRCCLLAESRLPDGWLHELKLDGYRALAARIPANVMAVTPTTVDYLTIVSS